MQKEGRIYKTLICGGELSLAVLDTTAPVREAIARHGLFPAPAAAFGRTLTACAYLCSWLKSGESSLSVSISGGGAGGKLCLSGDGNLDMRGFLENPRADLPPRADGKLDVGGCVGREGTLTVTRDDGTGVPFVGTSPLVSGEIAEDFSAYFYASEQRPTAIALGVQIGRDGDCLAAGGVFLQPLPGAGEESLLFAEREIGKYGALSSVLLAGGARAILSAFGAEDVQERAVRYRCHCSRERAERILLSLGRDEAQAIVREEGRVNVHCDYCNTDYTFDAAAIGALFAQEEET